MLWELHWDSKSFLSKVLRVGVYFYSKTLNGSADKCYKDALKFYKLSPAEFTRESFDVSDILDMIPEKYPVVGIEQDMLYDYFHNDKTYFDIICLSAFLGIKSILGTKSYCKTNKSLIHARMFGYSTPKDMPAQLPPLEEKYKIRWHMDKVLQELQTDWYLKTISNHQRGMYVSFDLSIQELAVKSEMNKQFTKAYKLKALKREAIKDAKSFLTTH
jgi:hypothetical protein